jgi:hypothetical protein
MRGKKFSGVAFFLFSGILVTLFSAILFIPLHADHACTHDEYCPGCLQLRGTVNLLSHLEPVYARHGAAIIFFGIAVLLSKFSFPGLAAFTSISLKVRMNT